MMKNRKKIFLTGVLLFLCFSGLHAQTSNTALVSTEFETSRAPQWARDLRRAEIISFGAFPLMYLLTSSIMDWSAADFTQKHRLRSVGIAAGGAVMISLVDYSIVLIKRKREEREIRSLPPGTPIIIRTPINEDNDELPEDAPETESR